jgi:hypothetical protein
MRIKDDVPFKTTVLLLLGIFFVLYDFVVTWVFILSFNLCCMIVADTMATINKTKH